jgi:hypothetical protein
MDIWLLFLRSINLTALISSSWVNLILGGIDLEREMRLALLGCRLLLDLDAGSAPSFCGALDDEGGSDALKSAASRSCVVGRILSSRFVS